MVKLFICKIFPLYGYYYTLMKGTKVLTLGAGREVLPHNMAVTKMYIDADDIYTRYTHTRYC